MVEVCCFCYFVGVDSNMIAGSYWYFVPMRTMDAYMCTNLVDYMLVSDDLYSCISIKNSLNDNLSLNVFASWYFANEENQYVKFLMVSLIWTYRSIKMTPNSL